MRHREANRRRGEKPPHDSVVEHKDDKWEGDNMQKARMQEAVDEFADSGS
jgi:hypothetical protein